MGRRTRILLRRIESEVLGGSGFSISKIKYQKSKMFVNNYSILYNNLTKNISDFPTDFFGPLINGISRLL